MYLSLRRFGTSIKHLSPPPPFSEVAKADLRSMVMALLLLIHCLLLLLSFEGVLC